MATTQEIIQAAQELGKLIATHETARRFNDLVHKLQQDVEAQRLLTDLNRQMEKMAEKESQGRPVEVAEKRQLDTLRNAVVRHPTLQQFQMVQMDYLDLMRKVDEAIDGVAEVPEAAPPASGPIGRVGL